MPEARFREPRMSRLAEVEAVRIFASPSVTALVASVASFGACACTADMPKLRRRRSALHQTESVRCAVRMGIRYSVRESTDGPELEVTA